jgi:signal transduction histidine kinase
MMMEENRRILVVDDDRAVRGTFLSIFGRAKGSDMLAQGAVLFGGLTELDTRPKTGPYEVFDAESGEAGVRAVEAALEQDKPFAAAFVDMKMPGIDGAETVRRIWALDPRVKIVIVTAYSEFQPEAITDIAGREDLLYVRKPFTLGEIRQFARSQVRQWALERERERLQKELEAANALLEEKVAARTRDLREAHRRLEVLDKDKLTFLRYLSHEMNTPLNWIGAANIIDRRLLDQSDQEMLGFVEKGFERLSALTAAVLDYFEMAGSDLEVKPEPIRLRKCISDIVQERASRIREKGVRVDLDMAEDLAAQGDPRWFQELMKTLVDNAIDYSPAGGIVTVMAQEDEAGFHIGVRDRGKGIPKENLEAVFKAFALDATARHESGMGLSLPRAKLIADAHGWTIRAESEGPDQGTTVSLVMGR